MQGLDGTLAVREKGHVSHIIRHRCFSNIYISVRFWEQALIPAYDTWQALTLFWVNPPACETKPLESRGGCHWQSAWDHCVKSHLPTDKKAPIKWQSIWSYPALWKSTTIPQSINDSAELLIHNAQYLCHSLVLDTPLPDSSQSLIRALSPCLSVKQPRFCKTCCKHRGLASLQHIQTCDWKWLIGLERKGQPLTLWHFWHYWLKLCKTRLQHKGREGISGGKKEGGGKETTESCLFPPGYWPATYISSGFILRLWIEAWWYQSIKKKTHKTTQAQEQSRSLPKGKAAWELGCTLYN